MSVMNIHRAYYIFNVKFNYQLYVAQGDAKRERESEMSRITSQI